MSTIQRFISGLVAFLLLLTFATLVPAGKPEKRGGGGKPPAEKDDPVAVVSVVTSIVIDGYMDDWIDIKPEPESEPEARQDEPTPRLRIIRPEPPKR